MVALLLAEISNGKKKKNRLTFRSRIETRWAITGT